MTPLPPQHPVQPPRYRFRPRSDKGWHMPRLTGPHELDTEPFDQPQPLQWSDFREWRVWVGGLVVFLAIAAFVVAVSIQDVRP